MELPDIVVVVTTWAPDGEVGRSRAVSVYKAVVSWNRYLSYEGHVSLHVADDGSTLPGFPQEHRWTGIYETTFSRQERGGVGASLNAGFNEAFKTTPLVAYLVDDWALTAPFDLTPWAQVLLEDESVGMVRLGPPHPDLAGRIEHRGELPWTLRLDRHHYAFGHRPALYHKRMIDAYGWFTEGVNAMDCEAIYNQRFCNGLQQNGRYATGGNSRRQPDIVLALPHPWDHVGDAEVGYVVPEVTA